MSAKTEQVGPRRGLDSGEAPSWVHLDAACRHAWAHDRQWRKVARSALPPVHRPPGDGGTTGDALVARAQRAYQQAGGVQKRREPRVERHHAAECPCNPCRKRRGEKALPTLRQQQERRKRAIGAQPGSVGYEPGDRQDWLLTAQDRVRWTRVVDAERDAKEKITRCELRPEWLGYLDALLRKGALEELWQSQPHLARAFCGHALDGRTQDTVAKSEGVSRATISRRVAQARTFLAERMAG